MSKPRSKPAAPQTLRKAPTGIEGLDEITGGGLPLGRPTLICGSAGCGKTLMAMEFLVRGATQFGEPGVFMAFEETARELTENVRSLGFDLDQLCADKRLRLDYVRIERGEIEEAGEYDLEGLFVRLGHAIDTIQAKRVVLDTLEALFAGLDNQAVLRAELRRLFRWLKDRGVTAVITGERGDGRLTRHGLEEYVSDCVILLDHRVVDQLSTRRLRIVKYRGTTHGTNEYPFLIDEKGTTVLPITSLGLQHVVSDERMSSGVPRLDAMLGREGYFRGSTVLVSGTAGGGKTSLAASFADATCRRGERCAYFAFEESPSQLMRNMRSIGIDLEPWVKKGLLRFHASRPTAHGLEMHLASVLKEVRDFKPQAVVLDPISTFDNAGALRDAYAVLTRLIDSFKSQTITVLMTNLNTGPNVQEETDIGISSLVDTWLLVRDIELGGERNRGLYVLKSRGMAHSNQIREFKLSDSGIELLDVYLGPQGVLTGSLRQAQEARERAEALERQQALAARQRDIERRRMALDARIAALREELEIEQSEAALLVSERNDREAALEQDRAQMRHSRRADTVQAPAPARAAVGAGRKRK